MDNAVATPHGSGPHVVGFYNQDSELVSRVAQFCGNALQRNGAAIIVATAEHRRALVTLLAEAGHPISDLIASGRIQSIDAGELLASFMADAGPDAEKFAAALGPVIESALAFGGPVQVFGEMVALLFEQGNVNAAVELEGLWNELAPRYEFALFCAYTMSSLEACGDLGAAKRVCDAHSSLIAIDDRPTAALGNDRDDSGIARVFVPTPVVLRRVRRFVRDALRDSHDAASLAEIEVVACELATNAVVHARTPFRVSIARTPRSVKIAVTDASFARPQHLDAHADRDGGRGVGLVAAFSKAWGTVIEADGKTVWAEVLCPEARGRDQFPE